TRFSRDWSSDVCSSDLAGRWFATQAALALAVPIAMPAPGRLAGGTMGGRGIMGRGKRWLVAAVAVLAPVAQAHPGGLDANGCHKIGRASCRGRESTRVV